MKTLHQIIAERKLPFCSRCHDRRAVIHLNGDREIHGWWCAQCLDDAGVGSLRALLGTVVGRK